MYPDSQRQVPQLTQASPSPYISRLAHVLNGPWPQNSLRYHAPQPPCYVGSLYAFILVMGVYHDQIVDYFQLHSGAVIRRMGPCLTCSPQLRDSHLNSRHVFPNSNFRPSQLVNESQPQYSTASTPQIATHEMHSSANQDITCPPILPYTQGRAALAATEKAMPVIHRALNDVPSSSCVQSAIFQQSSQQVAPVLQATGYGDKTYESKFQQGPPDDNTLVDMQTNRAHYPQEDALYSKHPTSPIATFAQLALEWAHTQVSPRPALLPKDQILRIQSWRAQVKSVLPDSSPHEIEGIDELETENPLVKRKAADDVHNVNSGKRIKLEPDGNALTGIPETNEQVPNKASRGVSPCDACRRAHKKCNGKLGACAYASPKRSARARWEKLRNLKREA